MVSLTKVNASPCFWRVSFGWYINNVVLARMCSTLSLLTTKSGAPHADSQHTSSNTISHTAVEWIAPELCYSHVSLGQHYKHCQLAQHPDHRVAKYISHSIFNNYTLFLCVLSIDVNPVKKGPWRISDFAFRSQHLSVQLSSYSFSIASCMSQLYWKGSEQGRVYTTNSAESISNIYDITHMQLQ